MWTTIVVSASIVGILTIAAFASQKVYMGRIKLALLMGLCLMGLDFAIETIGGYLNLWFSDHAFFYVGYIPIELMLTAFWMGVLVSFIFPVGRNWIDLEKLPQQVILIVFTCFAGATFEFILQQLGFMTYTENWNFILSFLSYALIFGIWSQIHHVITARTRFWGEKDEYQELIKKKKSNLDEAPVVEEKDGQDYIPVGATKGKSVRKISKKS